MNNNFSLSQITLLLLSLAFVVFGTRPVYAAECAMHAVESIIDSKIVTADSWPNLMRHEGSISFESERMLKSVEAKINKISPPAEQSCPAACRFNTRPKIIFSSIPNAFLSEYSGKQKCDALFEQTKSEPLIFAGKRFKSLADFNSWTSDFSQGKGKEGNLLYRKCDGSCSPQYLYQIVMTGEQREVEAEVVCGPARNRSENRYQLKVGFRWQCEPI